MLHRHPRSRLRGRQLAFRIDRLTTKRVRPRVNRMSQHIRQSTDAWAAPVQLPLLSSGPEANWQLHVIADQPMKHPIDGAQFIELIEDESDDFLGLLIG